MKLICWIFGHRFGNEVTIELETRSAEKSGQKDTVRIPCQRCGRDFDYYEYRLERFGETLIPAEPRP